MSTHDEVAKASPEGRDSSGRFTEGNAGGPGNPYARRVAQMRSLAVEVVTDDDLAGILQKMVALAKEGDVAAAKVVLQYTLGKPIDHAHPDRIDRDEMDAWKQNALREGDQQVALSTPVGPVLLAARELGPLNARRFAHGLADGLRRQADDQADSPVNKRGKPVEPAPVSAGPPPSATPTEADAARPPKGRRAANGRRP